MQGCIPVRKRVYRVADKQLPGSFIMAGLNYIDLAIGVEDGTGKFVVKAGSLMSKPMLSQDLADKEHDRLSKLSVISMEDLEGYK